MQKDQILKIIDALSDLMRDFWLLDKQQKEDVKNLALFYPESGYDLTIPIEIFAPYITDFWFVDDGYFCGGNPRKRHSGHYRHPVDEQRPLSWDNDHDFEFLQRTLQDYPDWEANHADIKPCTLTDTFTHKTTQREIRIHRHRGCALTLLHHEPALQRLGVFFYRGNYKAKIIVPTPWLQDDYLDEVLNRLIHGGLLVLDGTDVPHTSPQTGTYSELCYYVNNPVQRSEVVPEQLVKDRNSFSDAKQRVFQCVGFAGMYDYPSLIWQVHSGEGAPTQMLDGQNHAKEAWEIEAEDREKQRLESDKLKQIEAERIAIDLLGHEAIFRRKGVVLHVQVRKMKVDNTGVEIMGDVLPTPGLSKQSDFEISGVWSITSVDRFSISIGYGGGELYINQNLVDDIVAFARTLPCDENNYPSLSRRINFWSDEGFDQQKWEWIGRHD